MSPSSALQADYPLIKIPLVASAPMLNIATAPLSVAVSEAGGLGFLAGGFDVSSLESKLEEVAQLIQRFLNWGADLAKSIAVIGKYRPCAAWFFGPKSMPDDLQPWAEQVRTVTNGQTKAVAVVETLEPDVLVVQGSDAGGHGLARSASIITLVPEVKDTLAKRQLKSDIPLLAAGGIVDGRGMAASLALGASGVAMGTRFLASSEANIAHGYQDEVIRVSDGGATSVRSTVYDRVRGILDWPTRYDGRGIINKSYTDAMNGMSDEENRALYEEELKKGDLGWGPDARLTTYAGTGVGLVNETLPAADILASVIQGAQEILQHLK
ncbi:hypothetical protein BJX64DRAFT_298750 [Aspergillus heterothallicus]